MPDFTRFPIRAVTILLLIPALLLPFSAFAGSQKLVLRDGDSFALNGEEFRIWGIDAPELFQTCRNSAGESYSCGRQAKEHLRKIIGARAIRCEPAPRAKKETRAVARCFVDGEDLGQLMVRDGFAVEYSYFSKGTYAADEREAKTSRRGLWAGSFQNPRDWRKSSGNRY